MPALVEPQPPAAWEELRAPRVVWSVDYAGLRVVEATGAATQISYYEGEWEITLATEENGWPAERTLGEDVFLNEEDAIKRLVSYIDAYQTQITAAREYYEQRLAALRGVEGS